MKNLNISFLNDQNAIDQYNSTNDLLERKNIIEKALKGLSYESFIKGVELLHKITDQIIQRCADSLQKRFGKGKETLIIYK